MPALRKVYGPFHPEYLTTLIRPAPGQPYETAKIGVCFHFFGIRDDHTMAAWELRFVAKERKYQAISVQIGDVGRKGRDIVPDIRKAEVVDKEMFIKGEKLTIETGKITDILRKKLKPEHIAMCMALTIKR